MDNRLPSAIFGGDSVMKCDDEEWDHPWIQMRHQPPVNRRMRSPSPPSEDSSTSPGASSSSLSSFFFIFFNWAQVVGRWCQGQEISSFFQSRCCFLHWFLSSSSCCSSPRKPSTVIRSSKSQAAVLEKFVSRFSSSFLIVINLIFRPQSLFRYNINPPAPTWGNV